MKKRFVLGLCCLVLAVVGHAGPRDGLWQKVDDARKASLPKSAIEALEPIITAALAERAYPEAIKAIGQKIALEGVIHGNKPEQQIARLLAALERVPAEMKPMMHVLLVHWYLEYFRGNRWRFSQRTAMESVESSSLETWDLRRILTEIDRHFQAALSEEKWLKQTSIQTFDVLIDRGNVPEHYRPTLYDFLGHEALAFYQAGEMGGILAEDEFELLADSPVFDDTKQFLSWVLPPGSRYSPKLQAVILFQKLLCFHEGDVDRTAYFDLDFARLEFGRNFAVGENVTQRHAAAMRRLATEASDNEVSSAVYAALAKQLKAIGQLAAAHAEASKGREVFPASIGGRRCENLIIEIEKPELSRH